MIFEFIREFNHVKRVVESCKTPEQYENATKWAKNWSIASRVKYPNFIEDCNKLYEEVVNE